MIYASAGIPCQPDPAEPKAKADTRVFLISITEDPDLPSFHKSESVRKLFRSQRGGSGGMILLH